MELRAAALHALLDADPAAKARAVAALSAACKAGQVAIDTQAVMTAPPGIPGRPARPELVPPL